MASICEQREYYKKMFELQEKLRKSEEERIRLEERFNLLTQESKNRHGECINRLRLRYIEYLEEQRSRDERNHNLLGALDKVDNNLAEMTAKTRRLNILRKQYEAYLLRAYRRNTPGATGSSVVDSGVGSQIEGNDKLANCRQKEATVLTHLQPGDVLSTTELNTLSIDRVASERFLRHKSPIRVEIRPDINSRLKAEELSRNFKRFTTNVSRDNVTPVRNEFRQSSNQHFSSPQRFESAMNARPARRFQQTQEYQSRPYHGNYGVDSNAKFVTNSMKNISGQGFTPWSHEAGSNEGWSRLYGQSAASTSEHDDGVRDRTTKVLENELDRYIDNIKSLHRTDFEPASVNDELELDHEQNTSGDLLNVTLSDEGDARDEVSAENRPVAKWKERRKPREERLPVEVEGVIALATDLASRTVEDSKDVEVKEHEKNEEYLPSVQENTNHSERNSDDEIRERNSNTAGISKDRNLFMGEISEVGSDFYTVEEMEPWDLKFVEKQIREILNENKELTTNTNVEESLEANNVLVENFEDHVKKSECIEIVKENENEQDIHVVNETVSSEEKSAPSKSDSISTKDENQQNKGVVHQPSDETSEKTKVLKENVNEHYNNHSRMENEESNNPNSDEKKEHNQGMNADEDNVKRNWQDGADSAKEEGYVQNPAEETRDENYGAEQEYYNEEYQQDSDKTVYQQEQNQEYSYYYNQEYQNDPNQTYENDPDQSYENQQNQQHENGQNQTYENNPNQSYENDQNQQYEFDSNQHYKTDPNQHYEENSNEQFENDANQHYSTDPNQSYQYDPSEHYEDNQVYTTDPNESYQIDPNQPYENSAAESYDYAEENNYDDRNQTLNAGDATNTNVEEYPQQQTVENELDESEINVNETEEKLEKESEKVQNQAMFQENLQIEEEIEPKKKKDVIRSLLDSETESTIERNVSNTDSDFDFN